MSGYERAFARVTDDTIEASDFVTEFQSIDDAFNASSGHDHSGAAGEGGAIAKLGDDSRYNQVIVSAANDRIEFHVNVSSASVEQLRIQDGVVIPVTTNDIDLGSGTYKYKDGYFAGNVSIGGNVVVSGTVDGRDVGTDGTKLDTIESSATADQTGAEIKALYEAEADTNAYTDAEQAKVGYISVTQAVDLDSVETQAAAANTHITSNGTDHGYIDQDVTTTGTPTFASLTLSGALTVGGTVDGRDVASDGAQLDTNTTKLAGIEAGAEVNDPKVYRHFFANMR